MTLCCCDTGPPPPTGACCEGETGGVGICNERTEAECAANNGDYQGDGTDCDPNPCPTTTGACCLPDGSCIDTVAIRCTALGGDFKGLGTECASTDCPQPTGACCEPDGTCVERTQVDCVDLGHAYQGDGTVCTPNPCPIPNGVCCTAPPGPEICTDEPQTTCEQQGNVWLPNRQCADVSCACIRVVGGAVPNSLSVNFSIPEVGADFRMDPAGVAQAMDWLNGTRIIPLNPASGLGVCFYSVSLSWPNPNFDPFFPGYAVNLDVTLTFQANGALTEGWLEAEVRLSNTYSLRYDHSSVYRSNPENLPYNAFGAFTMPGGIPPDGNPNFEEFFNACDGVCTIIAGQGTITTNAQ